MKKILHTIYTCLLWMGFVGFALSGCKDDELVKNNGEVVEGVPITVNLNISGKAVTDVTVETRASGSNYSWLSDVVICVFHGEGSFEQIVTNYGDNKSLEVDQYADSETDNDGNRRYKVSFKSTSGTKKLIAVANVADGGYWEGLVDLLKEVYDNKRSFDEVKELIAGLNENILKQAASEDGVPPFSIASSSQMFMSGWNQNVEFKTDGSVTQGDYGSVIDNNVIAVQMYRSMAHITFNIAAAPERAKGIFTPTSYRVYNIPTKSYLMNDTQGGGVFALTSAISGVEEKIGYIHTASSIIGTAQGGNYSFNFYMPENVQEAGTNAITGEDTKQLYQLRDMWESQGNSGAAPENKDWTHAPDQSTFVVISGTYESKSTATDEHYIGNVEYTIHLGDFSTETGSLNNFSVERNVSYTYNVQVLGVKNIVVEATTNIGEKQPGAEGSIYDRADTEYAYNLDAHYEQVFLEYNLSNIVAELKKQGLSNDELDEAIANQLVLVIQSEAMDHNSDGVVNKRGSLRPYKIYADAIAQGEDAAAKAKADILNGDMDGSATPTKGFDYKWIEFWPQTGTTIAAYPGMSSWARESLDGMANSDFYEGNAQGRAEYLMDVYDVIVEMGKKVKALYLSTDNTLTENSGAYPQAAGEIMITKNGNDYVARFTAFVNEYYYLRHPLTGAKVSMWSVMTNKIPREMIIAMSTKTSLDGNSSYSKIHSYISQLSMETFYSDRAEDSNLNAFGMETYNETPLYSFGKKESTTDGLLDSDGRENQKTLIGASSKPSWGTYIKASGNGWTSSVGTDHANHKLTGAYSIQAAYSACMSRNRDLNGNGKIDENEIRWYLASLNEYIRMGIGANAISSAAKLFTGDKTAMKKGATATSSDGYPSAYIKDGSLYYTSSSSGKRVYWAIEKGSYGAINSGYDSSPLPIRCIRVLPSPSGKEGQDISSITGITSDATYEELNDKGLKVLKFEGRLMSSLYRPTRVSGSLDPHNEDEGANSFYRGIFVADDFLMDRGDNILGYTLSEITGNGSTMNNPCLSYEEGGYRNWRVPNLVELSAMNAAGLLNDCYDAEYGRAASCTQFSNLKVRYGFARSILIFCPGAKGNELDLYFRIRCVRDVPANYTFPTN
ncbi:MAG: DUF4906 domain-containing protein [Candidatus Phocaeicola faecigallinarum]|uniref:DUF4906 domain-containing protein n=1 Tax=Candidatus Phocaeicola faecigallinarum TaxID=2838732 RepID=A0A948TD01_9BACT|nr:DUF4906 domain-containing protein [Candidatus Phocaeicola faecigallinarum]